MSPRDKAFLPGERVICTHAGQTSLTRGEIYTVVDDPTTALIALEERPGALFHEKRFEPAKIDRGDR